MIVSIEGTLEEKTVGRAVVSVTGIGYEVFTTDDTLASVDQNQKIKLYIHEQIKEDVHDLYGFLFFEEKELFEKLLSVKNVGPRVALSVLNIGSAEKVKGAIVGGDAVLLQSAKGVGRRAAEQIIVELRDRLGLSSSDAAEAVAQRSGGNLSDEAVEALMSLGYSSHDASAALAGIDKEIPVEARIKQALKKG